MEEEAAPSSGGSAPPSCSPASLLARLQTRFQQGAEDLQMTREQNADLEKRIKTLTENILTANEEKETLKSEHRAALCHLEEAALAERRRYEGALCAARQHQHRCQMDLELATEELAELRAQVKTLQMDKVSLARQVRDLEAEVKARCRLQQNASDQMVRHNQAKNKLNKEISGLVEWLERLEADSRAAAELNRRLERQLQHQSMRLEQLTAARAGETAHHTCPELDELRTLLERGKHAGRDSDAAPRTPPSAGDAPEMLEDSSTKAPDPGAVSPPVEPYRTEASADARKVAGEPDRVAPLKTDWHQDPETAISSLLVKMPERSIGTTAS